ncbi:hypothetical protein Syun_007873 [Stephania yunnanensis]|uniref:Uncharacterized protein n=1 Tax=Stephania yunnanensis TaxID=152371 RepID=A0AAP0KZ80_9MAGN
MKGWIPCEMQGTLTVTIQSNFLLFVPEFLQHHLQPSASLLACVVCDIFASFVDVATIDRILKPSLSCPTKKV